MGCLWTVSGEHPVTRNKKQYVVGTPKCDSRLNSPFVSQVTIVTSQQVCNELQTVLHCHPLGCLSPWGPLIYG